ncbi:MAG: FHA domain-containing protein [Candidatus Ancillula trichonymphae]|jgi:pSer/pThr/pTyr-binding forkhead associated (FHA) protein|nr:FHA domain-containing protein [Candidatus Ancillula trichonymphae]
MKISDATNIGIPRINEPLLGTNPMAKGQIDIGELDVKRALLISMKTDEQRFLLDDDLTTAGREGNAGIFLDDPSVSRRHAEFTRIGTKFYVEDVGSLNGTYVNEQLQEARYPLNNGDEVQIGRFRLLFVQKQQ